MFAPNYTYLTYNSAIEGWEETSGDVYLCWDADDGEITAVSQRDLTEGSWDIFDATSGAWLSYGEYGGWID